MVAITEPTDRIPKPAPVLTPLTVWDSMAVALFPAYMLTESDPAVVELTSVHSMRTHPDGTEFVNVSCLVLFASNRASLPAVVKLICTSRAPALVAGLARTTVFPVVLPRLMYIRP